VLKARHKQHYGKNKRITQNNTKKYSIKEKKEHRDKKS